MDLILIGMNVIHLALNFISELNLILKNKLDFIDVN